MGFQQVKALTRHFKEHGDAYAIFPLSFVLAFVGWNVALTLPVMLAASALLWGALVMMTVKFGVVIAWAAACYVTLEYLQDYGYIRRFFRWIGR